MNLKTISINHLNEWKQNSNNSRIIGIDDDLIRSVYYEFFKALYDQQVKNVQIVNFTKDWTSTCSKYCKIMSDTIKAQIVNPAPNIEEDLTKVVQKFRGNVAEILCEAAVNAGYFSDWVSIDGYEPVDPHHEEKLDAVGKTGLGDFPIGIQVKNWSVQNKVDRDVFWGVSGMAHKWLKKKILPPEVLDLDVPYMYVISFGSDGYLGKDTNKDLYNEFNGSIAFKGPDYVSSRLMHQVSFFSELANYLK